MKVESFHNLVFEKVDPLLLGFPVTWLIEAGFSTASDVLKKKKNNNNLLQIDKRRDLRLKLKQRLEFQNDKLIDKYQKQCFYYMEFLSVLKWVRIF